MVIPELMQVSTLQKSYRSVIDKLANGPVVLANYARPVAVVISPDQFERLSAAAEELKRLQRILKYDKDFEEARKGKYTEG